MARHGECAPVESLRRKLPDMPDMPEIDTPSAFVALMEAAGHQVTSHALAIPHGQAFAIDVPELSLHLIFVERAICNEIGAMH